MQRMAAGLAALFTAAAWMGCGDDGTTNNAAGSGGAAAAGSSSSMAGTSDATSSSTTGSGSGGAPGGCTGDSDCTAPSLCDVARCVDGECQVAPKVCTAPPEEMDWAQVRQNGAMTFTTRALGGACNASCNATTGACEYTDVVVDCPEPAAFGAGHLPQDHIYQVVLRNYMKALEAAGSAFDVPLANLAWNDAGLDTTDKAFPVWILLRNRGYETPSAVGLRAGAGIFALSSLEQPDGIHLSIGRAGFFEPMDAAFWHAWSYAGNPHAGSLPVMRRAFEATALDIMLVDTHHESGGTLAGMAHFQGPYLTRHALTYELVKPALLGEPNGACVAAAYEVALRKQFDRFVDWDGSNGNTDMEAMGMIGLFAAARATGDTDLLAAAVAETDKMLAPSFEAYDEAGYYYHGEHGPDLSYNGVSMHFVLAAALHGASKRIDTVASELSTLKAFLTLPEPTTDPGFIPGMGNTVQAPSHMNTADAKPPTADQWSNGQRDYGAMMLTDEARYLAWGGRNLPSYYARDVPADMTELTASLDKSLVSGNYLGASDPADGFAPIDTPYTGQPTLWKTWADDGKNYHWNKGIFASVLWPRPGTFDNLAAVRGTDAGRAPFLRAGDFTQAFGRDFFVAKRGDFGAILYLAELGKTWAGGMAGFGSGCLSAFWTAGAGPIILGWGRGTQGGSQFDWADWRDFPFHATTGRKAGAYTFSTARVRVPSSVTLDTAAATSTAISIIDTTAASAMLPSDITVTRAFAMLPDGIHISTTLAPAGPVAADELFESLPFFETSCSFPTPNSRVAATPVTFVFELSGGGTAMPSGAPVANVTAVVATREGKQVRVELDSARTVELTTAGVNADGSGTCGTNLLIHWLTGAADVPAASQVITIRRVP